MNTTKRNIFIGGILILGPLLFSLYKSIEEKPIENCKSSVKSSVVLVIDRTGTLAETTVNSIEQIVDETINLAEPFTILSVYYIQKDSLSTHPDFQTCIPPKKTALTALTQDEKKVQIAWDKFRDDFLKYLRKDMSVSPQSPIYGTVVDIIRDKKTIKDPAQSKLIIFSDFIEYSPVADLHSGCLNASQIQAKISQSLLFDPSDRPLSKIYVERFFIPRDGRSREYTECVKQISDMVFNRMGMEAPTKFVYLSKSPKD